MRGIETLPIVLTGAVVVAATVIIHGAPSQQRASSGSADAASVAEKDEAALPKDVYPDFRNRLPAIRRDDLDERGKKAYDAASSGATRSPQGAAAIRLHGSGTNVRWASPAGRQLTELAILTAAREHDQPYEWSLHEMEAVAVGLDPAVINIVRHRNPLRGVGDREAAIIQAGRELFCRHQLSSDTYARGLQLLGTSSLVDILDLMAGYSGTATRLTAFNQHMPPGWKQFLPLPFIPSNDIHQDSRSRLPLIRSQGQNQLAVPSLYSRQLAPEGTGPGQIARHGGGLASLEASAGPRLMALAILVTAREHDAQYEWTVNERAALENGLERSIVDIVRSRKSLTGLMEKEAALVEFGRELLGSHNVTVETYARALKAFGEKDLVDLVGLMAQHSSDAALVIAFDQHLPAGQKELLPIP
jgi:4-carboxymuconolactone decarboxylase